ncbi:MAG: protein-glutamate O-methyltransferase CheR [Candidatus Kapaibacterium sp.]|nr:MAG: protein-glutamate O-methyltransferase CheR [Candidatus Kapabacteria bacterium]
MQVPAIEDIVSVQLSVDEFDSLSRLVYDRFGIFLPPEKRTMVTVRLQKVLRKMGMTSFHEYHEYLTRAGGNSEALIEFANHITTNHTFFWREKDHFEFFTRQFLPSISATLSAKREFDLRIWCAGCSSGEESYMLQMLLMDYFGAEYPKWKAGVLATDISERALGVAEAGVYPLERIELLPDNYRRKYTKQLPTGEIQILPQVQKDVVYRKFNLMNTHFPFKRPFHAIFCRNVMIYFDKPTRDALVERFYNALEPGGFLFIGHSETISRDSSSFRYISPALYQKP